MQAPPVPGLPLDDPEAGVFDGPPPSSAVHLPVSPPEANAKPVTKTPPAPPSPAPEKEPSPAATPPPSDTTLATSPRENLDTPPDLIRGEFSLFVNEYPIGLSVVVLKDGDVFIKREDLAQSGLKVPFGKEEVIFGIAMMSLRSVSPPLSYRIDERAIELRVTAPATLFERSHLRVGRTPPLMTYQKETAGFLNYSLISRPRFRGGESDFTNLRVMQEFGVSHDGNLAVSSITYTPGLGSTRGNTAYIVNEQETRRRMTFGDAVMQGGPLGGSYQIGGWTLQRTFELDPYAVTSPGIGFSGVSAFPATLEVYVNGALTRREQLAPGPFTVELQNRNGAGVATYVVRDVYGSEQVLDIPYYVAGNVLTKGYDEYQFSVGAQRAYFGSRSFDYDRPVALGRHRIGVARALTLSSRFELGELIQSGGGGLTGLSILGQSEFEAALSREVTEGVGFGLFASHSYFRKEFGLSAQGLYQSENYLTPNVTVTPGRELRQMALSAFAPFKNRYSVRLNSDFRSVGEGSTQWNVGTGATAMLRKFIFSAGASVGAAGEGAAWSVVLGVTYRSGSTSTLSASGTASSEDNFLTLSAMRQAPPFGRNYGYQATLTQGEYLNANSSLQYQTEQVRLRTSYTLMEDPESYTHTLSAEAYGSLLAIPKVGIFPSLPVYRGFGLISVPGIKGVRGYVNNNEVGRTDRKGNLIVPSTVAYYGNNFSIAPEDLPLNYATDKFEQRIAPPQRGVALATFGVTKLRYYRGVLKVRIQGALVPATSGLLTVETAAENLEFPTSSEGDFELQSVPPGRHKAQIDFAQGICAFEIDAKESPDPVIDLGEVVCEMQ